MMKMKLVLFAMSLTILLEYQFAAGNFSEVSTKCKNQYLHFNNALKSQKNWALELYDSWGKFQYGILNGNSFNFGDFDKCVRFSYETTIADIGTIKGKHCMVSFSGTKTDADLEMIYEMRELGALAQSRNLSLITGLCFPDTCSIKDVQQIATHVMSKGDLEVTSTTCTSTDPIRFNIRILAVFIFAILLLTVAFSTIYDLNMKLEEKSPHSTLVAFSIHHNGNVLFDVSRGDPSQTVECIDGIRAISLLWIIFGHRRQDMFTAPATNAEMATEVWLKSVFSLSYTTFHLAIDTWFLLNGLLAARFFLRIFDMKQFNLLKMYFFQFLRYTPMLLFLLLFFVSFMPLLGSGPIFQKTIDGWLSNTGSWWSTALHVSNYSNVQKLFMNWTWFLTADFQLYLISPFLVYPAWRWGWKFFIVFPVAVLMSMIYLFVISLQNEIPVFVTALETKKHHDHSRLIYYPTHARCGPWIVGLGLGFIMYTFRNQKTKLNKRISRVLWIVATSLMTASVLGHYPFQQSNNHISYLFNAAYNALSRSCWAMSLAWVIFACHNGGGGFIRWFLCLSLFKPLARMSLSIYLTHRLHQILSIASMKLPYYLSVLNLLHAYFSDVIMSSFIGMAVYLCIEAPVTFFRNRLYQ